MILIRYTGVEAKKASRMYEFGDEKEKSVGRYPFRCSQTMDGLKSWN